MKNSTYDKNPIVSVPDSSGTCVAGWDACAHRLSVAVAERKASRTILAVECYPGVEEAEVLEALRRRLSPALCISASEALLPPEQIEQLVEPFLGGSDPVFGFLSGLVLPQFFSPEARRRLQQKVATVASGLVLIVGCGGLLIHEPDLLVYADLARWEIQKRFRRQHTGNLGAGNGWEAAGLKYKRAFFVDWRVADRWKRPLIPRWDFVLDTNDSRQPKLATGDAVRRGLRHTASRPFRVVPFFDPAPWGGQWMRENYGLEGEEPNFGWCFDCVPEENSLRLALGGISFELPSINLVFDQPRGLLGETVHARFGDEFPIRFDFLDTMGGGNLSFQVHPLTEYIQHHFGMHYTQDESYYLLDAAPDAGVFLGLKEGINPEQMVRDLKNAQAGVNHFPAEKYANRWPARKHDHFLIPAGTVHCSGRNSMVLEISATPYIFTFKLWDWARLGLEGKPRPIHLNHGIANIQWDRTTDWVRRNLINRVEKVAVGDGWVEERTGLHEREFIETRRYWFTDPTFHHTNGNLNVLNLVEGSEAVVESPNDAFEPFAIHYAETFIVPAAVGPYIIRPSGSRPQGRHGIIKAYVRGSVLPPGPKGSVERASVTSSYDGIKLRA